jgi:hypothetical protein
LYYSIQSFLNTDELTQTLAGVEIASEKFFTLPHFPFAVPLNGADRGGGGGGACLFQQTKNGLRTKFKSFNYILS